MTGRPQHEAFIEQLSEPFAAEALFDHMPDTVFFIKDRDGRYVSANQTLVERCGLRDKSELLGRRPSDVLGETLGRITSPLNMAFLCAGMASELWVLHRMGIPLGTVLVAERNPILRGFIARIFKGT